MRGKIRTDKEPLEPRQLRQWQKETVDGSEALGKVTVILPQLHAPLTISVRGDAIYDTAFTIGR